MKLSPVASSCDLDVAREIARRLHHQTQPAPVAARGIAARAAGARPAGRPTPPPPPAPPPPAPPPEPWAEVKARAQVVPDPPRIEQRPSPPPWLPPEAEEREPAELERPPFDEAPAATEPTPLESESEPAPEHEPAPPAPELELTDEPGPPSWDEPQPLDRSASQEPDDALDALTDQPAEADGFGLQGTPAIEVEEIADGPADFEEPPSPPELEALSEPLSDALPEPLPDALSDALADALPEADPFAGVGGEIPFEAPEPSDAEPLGGGGVGPEEEELFDTSPPPPSWGDIAENCMALAHATGALLADSGGQLVAVRGSWPEPGAEAIAARLVAMMDRTLRDAPTRSVSAPVGPQHLTAWRVPVGDRTLTTAFLADAPVGADVRPSIDAEIQSGASA